MMSPSTIRTIQQEAAEKAATERRIPFVYWDGDDLAPPFPFPNLGDYTPKGWERTDHFMVDSSGFGSPGEPALTTDQLVDKIKDTITKNPGKTIGWAVIEVGQFQVVLGQFEKVA